MKITDLLNAQSVKVGAAAASQADAIDQLVALQVAAGNVSDADGYKAGVLAREAEFSTAVGDGIAIPWLYLIYCLILLVGLCNAVNLTDGLDGLAAGTVMVVMLVMAAIAFRAGVLEPALFAGALAGACIGFLWFNSHPAVIFMGDTGSMFLGGMVVAIAYALNCPLILLLTGIIYVIEGASDVLQIGYFKITHGKRIFKMAPIHHHFEMSGWSEKKIVAVFSIVNAVGGAAAIALMYFGGYAI